MSTNSRIPNGNTVTRMSAPHRELTVTDNDWLLRGLNLDAACQVCTLTMFYRFHKFFFFFQNALSSYIYFSLAMIYLIKNNKK
jgi:hypothetical protein